MEFPGIDVLGFAFAVIVAVIGSVTSIANNAPSRSRLLSDIEILERMMGMNVTKGELVYLAALRASISDQVKEIALPKRRYFAISTAITLILAIAFVVASYQVLYRFFMSNLFAATAFAIIAFPVGYAIGTLVSSLAISALKKKMERTDDFLKEVSREVENGMSEKGEHSADDGEDDHEPADEGEYDV